MKGISVLQRFFPIAIIAALLAVPLIGEPFYTRLLSRIMIYAIVAMSLDLLLGYGGMVSLGHAAFFGVGVYTVGILAHHGVTEALLSWPAAVCAAVLISLAIGIVSLRTAGAYFIMITLAFAQMLYYFSFTLKTYGGSDGMRMASRNSFAGILPMNRQEVFYYLVLALTLLVFTLCRRIVRSQFGLVIGGIREDEQRMRSLGYAVFRHKLVCFALSAALAGFAGALMANQTLYVTPSFLHWTQSGHILVMVILGGMGTLIGPMLGALALLLAEEVLSGFTTHWMIFLGPFLIAMVLFGKSGLYGWVSGALGSERTPS
jgi:branched-chain amino acid transport system permease protein